MSSWHSVGGNDHSECRGEYHSRWLQLHPISQLSSHGNHIIKRREIKSIRIKIKFFQITCAYIAYTRHQEGMLVSRVHLFECFCQNCIFLFFVLEWHLRIVKRRIRRGWKNKEKRHAWENYLRMEVKHHRRWFTFLLRNELTWKERHRMLMIWKKRQLIRSSHSNWLCEGRSIMFFKE